MADIHVKYDKLEQIHDLKPHPKNPNKHSKEQIQRLAKVLKYQGWRYPIKVSKQSGFITSGHGRVEAAKKNGWNEVPVSYQDYSSEEQEYADLVSDNSIASWADLDLKSINIEVPTLGPDFDIDLLGIKDFEIDASSKYNAETEDEVPEINSEASRTKPGDLYQLGEHRLLCGDSTSIDAVEKLMGGEKADMVFTDPPYGIESYTDTVKNLGKNARSKKYDRIIGDGEPFDPGMIFGFFGYCAEIYIWGADYFAEKIPDIHKGSWLVWDKRVTGHEDKKNYASEFELLWSKSHRARRIFKHDWVLFFGLQKEDLKTRVHPNQKPVKLFTDIFPEGFGKVVDLYGGSGSTLIACEKTNRKCFMMEIDPHYCDVIVERWEKYTSKKSYSN